MSFIRLRVSGAWTAGTTVSPAEFEQFDANLANAIDGKNGGAYSFQNNLYLGGAPNTKVEMAIPLELDDNLVVHGGTYLYGSLVASGDVAMGNASHPVYIGGETTFDENVTFNDDVSFQDQVVFHDDVEFNDPLLINGAINSYGPATFNGYVELADVAEDFVVRPGTQFFNIVTLHSTLTANEAVLFAGNGRIVNRVVAGSSSNATYNPSSVDVVYASPGTIGVAGVAYTIDDTGCVDGDWIKFCSPGNNQLDIKNPAGIAFTPPLKNSSGFAHDITCHRVAGVWVVTSRSLVP